jgi:hypothetical protein
VFVCHIMPCAACRPRCELATYSHPAVRLPLRIECGRITLAGLTLAAILVWVCCATLNEVAVSLLAANWTVFLPSPPRIGQCLQRVPSFAQFVSERVSALLRVPVLAHALISCIGFQPKHRCRPTLVLVRPCALFSHLRSPLPTTTCCPVDNAAIEFGTCLALQTSAHTS